SVDITSTGTLIAGRGRIGGFSGGINYSHTVTFLASGNWTITATHAGGVETGTSNSITVTNPAPVFSNIAPTSSIKGQSVDILINGSGFISGVTSISFGPNTTVTKGPTIISFYTLAATVLIDTGATEGPRTFRITNDPPGGGTAVVTNAFTIGSHPLPTLTSILPAQGNRLQTLGVVIKGSNFSSGVTSISLGQGITINSLSVDSATGISASITITVNAPVGAHDLVAINAPPGGGPDTLKGAFTVINPYPQVSAPTLISPFNGATNLYTRQQLRWTSDTAATSYHVQLSLQNTFATLLLDNPALTDTTCVVRGLLNDTTYYWRVSGANIGGSGPYSGAFSFSTGALYPSKFAVTDSVYFPARANPGDYPSTDYQIFGLPGASYKPLSSYMSGTVKQDWIAYWDNGAASNFWVAYSASNPIFTFAPGRAFWILQKGSLMLRDSVASAPLDTSGSARIGLQAGWNLISNPFPVPINWSYVQSLSGEPADSLQLWMYDGGFSLATTFLPYTGYYVYNGPYTPQGTATATVLDSLSIPFSGLGTLSKSVAKVAAGDWRVAVSLKSDVGMDRSTAFGASSGAAKGLNRFNYRKPRPMAGIPEVYFNRSEWDPVYNVFATDIRPTVGTLEKWSMEISSSLHKPMQLQFDGVVNVPPDLEVYLIDETDARSADLRKSGTYPFRPAMDISRFTIVVGSAEAVKREIESILPRDFSLGVNYPNPFNPTTTIPVALPVHAQIQLKIYNILGQEVRTVFDGALDGGRYWFTWDGRNESGAPVATGVYISRLTTSTGKQYTGKMLLLK
ncbi:MAG TPA: FlgD immunoglobulin-like domain containing protein, partial [Bacteroidota bacterium]|nr:FlgD immunoglobulin-like domain containing protein [Bacteroidota bacterium]